MYLLATKLFEGEKSSRIGAAYTTGIRRQEDNHLMYRFEAGDEDHAQEILDRLNNGVTA